MSTFPCCWSGYNASRGSRVTARTRTRTTTVKFTLTPYTWAEKFESFEWINSIRETNGNFDSCNSCKRLVPSRLHELHESKFPFVSRIEFIRSKLSNFSAHVYGDTDLNVNVTRSSISFPAIFTQFRAAPDGIRFAAPGVPSCQTLLQWSGGARRMICGLFGTTQLAGAPTRRLISGIYRDLQVFEIAFARAPRPVERCASLLAAASRPRGSRCLQLDDFLRRSLSHRWRLTFVLELLQRSGNRMLFTVSLCESDFTIM